jgi:hypothetical protein
MKPTRSLNVADVLEASSDEVAADERVGTDWNRRRRET